VQGGLKAANRHKISRVGNGSMNKTTDNPLPDLEPPTKLDSQATCGYNGSTTWRCDVSTAGVRRAARSSNGKEAQHETFARVVVVPAPESVPQG
jgi:hypothetical protein